MKIQSVTLLASAAAASAATQLPSEISANSDLGRSILSQSRRLDQQAEEEEDAYAWIANYSLKFQGCRYHATFNSEADENGDVRVATSKLAHFRLCPADTCSASKGGGCTKNYGDYVVDLATFAKTFVEGQKRAREYECQVHLYDNCDCNDDDDQNQKDDGFNKDYCEYDCYVDAEMEDCVDRNPYNDDEESRDEFEAQEYAECREWEIPEDDDDANNGGRRHRRRLEDAAEEEEEEQYFIGPYCSADGGSVYLGLYTDDTCTNFADSNSGKDLYKELSGGEELPYGAESLITADCVTCVEQEDPDRQDEQDDAYEAEIEVSRQCGELYETAGKCESSINVKTSGMTSDPNTAACSYISGIQFTRNDGIIEIKKSKKASFFIFMFAMVFVGLAGVVYKLHKDIQDAKRSPLLEKEDSQEDKDLNADLS